MKIDDLRLSDRGRLLVLLNAANRGGLIIYREFFDSYVWLINERKILPFYYPFGMNPFPRSRELEEQLRVSVGDGEVGNGFLALITADDVKWISGCVGKIINFEEIKERFLKRYVYITRKGKEWVSQQVGIASDFEEVTDDLIRCLKLFVNRNRDELFRLIYDAVQSPKE